MTDEIGAVSLGVYGNIKPLERDLKKASARFKKFGSNVRKQIPAFTKWSAAGTAALAGFTAAIYKSQSVAIDNLAKTSDSLGIATEKLQALNHIAELNGVSSDQMAKGLQRMERGLGEAARKGGTTADALKDVGLSVDSLLKLSPDQQLTQLATAIGGVENQSIRASIASDLFGRDGLKMLKVLTQMRKEGIEPTARELESMGASISRIDAAKVEAANDAFFKASQVLRGAAQTLTVELAPYVEVVANMFTDAAKESGGFGDEVKTAIEGSLKAVGKFGNFLQGLKVAFKGIELIAVGFGAAAVSVFQLVAEAVAALSDGVIGNVNTIIKGLNKLPKVDIATIDPISDGAFMQGLRKFADEAREKVGSVRTEMHNMAMQEMPSKNIEAMLEKVAIKSEEAATKVASSVSKMINPQEEDAVNDDGFSSTIDRIKNQYITKEELFRQHKLLMSEIERGYREGDIESEAEYLNIKAQAQADHNKKVEQAVKRSQEAKKALEKVGQLSSIKNMALSLTKAFGITDKSNKRMFKAQKAFSLAQSVAALPSAVLQSYQRGGGFPTGLVPAGIMLGKGISQINAIKKSSYTGGGGSASAASGAGGSGGGSFSSGSQSAAPAPQAASNDSLLTVSGLDRGALFDDETVRSLSERILEHGRNGGRLSFA